MLHPDPVPCTWLARQAATAALEVDSSALFSLAASPASVAAFSVTSAAVFAACRAWKAITTQNVGYDQARGY